MADTLSRTAGSVTLPFLVCQTICVVSPDCALNDFWSRFRACVDSVPGSVNWSLYWLPEAALRPPITTRAANHRPSTVKRRRKHHRASEDIGESASLRVGG